ncbi:aldehyde ferredoxin oxidoreductase C-terminal domain-containing protein [Kibdelosporangium aridum]|uniref:aldehyde ferredoxin oxidoreductase C-terminal domain-containing protein n=1 Tax=Kibdelosporangium aridum TaxID=2030 RepID=UPI0005676678|nr:aldehyde ferredoxin oxidoreductase C-terminal domain-containing protein [Kibdelosporangium aridum]
MILRIDPTSGLSTTTDGPLGVRLLLAETHPKVSAYRPDQPIVFGVGHRALAMTRFALTAKSTQSGGIAESRVEGPFGPALGDTGFDGVVLTGRAARPCYVLIENGQARLIDASDLWRLDTAEVTDLLVARHGPATHVAAIGPAGENLIRFASLVTDRGYPAARMGAIFGAKRCKAVVVVNDETRPIIELDITADYMSRVPGNPLTRGQLEPPGFGAWPAGDLEGYLGARNYTTAKAHLDAFTPEAFLGRMTQNSGACPGCPQDCMKSFNGSPLHQQAVAAFAANLGIDDVQAVLELNASCLKWGVDPVSLAGVLAFRCELPGGPDFGDAQALVQLAGQVVWRTGEGAILADGVARAARAYGRATERFALHCKGIEMPVFDPRGNQGLALAFAVNPLGPRYDAVEHDIDFDPERGNELFIANAPECPPEGLPMESLSEKKVKLVADLMELWSGYDALGVCLFAAPPTRNLSEASAAELVSAVTGRNVTPAGIRAAGRQRLSLMRRYNRREGLTSMDDTLPDRFFTLPVDSGRLKGAVLDRRVFAAAVKRLRELLGWPPD